MTETNRALVTGGTGYLGSRLVRRLRADGWAVAVLVPAGSAGSSLAGVKNHGYDGSLASLQTVLGTERPDCVFHLATLFLAQHRADDIPALIAANVTLGAQLLEALADINRPPLINVATSWQTMDGSAYRPANLYAATKQAFVDILRYYVDACEQPAVSVHLFDTYGPDDPRGKLVSALIKAMTDGKALELSPGEQRLDLMHADDIADALLTVAHRMLNTVSASRRWQHGDCLPDGALPSHPLHDYALRSGRTLSLRELVALIERLAGRPLTVRWGARAYRPREIMSPLSPHPSLPDWAPKIALETGITDLIKSQTP
jgi:nucleoside-diphosphate-sugar epimerase